MSGLDLQRELAAADRTIPIIFITGHGDVPMSVEAMKAGAVEFLTKPFRDRALLDAIHKAIRQNIIIRKHRGEIAELQWDFHTIKPTFLLFGRKNSVRQIVLRQPIRSASAIILAERRLANIVTR